MKEDRGVFLGPGKGHLQEGEKGRGGRSSPCGTSCLELPWVLGIHLCVYPGPQTRLSASSAHKARFHLFVQDKVRCVCVSMYVYIQFSLSQAIVFKLF